MPITVPRRPDSYVPTAPEGHPNVPAGAFEPPRPIDLSGVDRVANEIAQRERDKHDQLAVLDADNQLSQLQTDLTTKATSMKGKDALAAGPQVDQDWQKGADQIRNTLTNDRQKLAFENRVGSRYSSLNETVARHTQNELDNYDNQTTAAALDNRMNDALTNYQDPTKVDGAIAETKAILADKARRDGWSPDRLQAATTDRVSKVHTAVINTMLANGNDLTASAYYAKVKDQIAGDDAAALAKALEEGSVRGESQRQADQITAKFADRKSAIDEAKKLKDPKVRDATVERVNQFFSEQNQAQQETREKNMLTATNIVDQTASIDRIPPAMWTTFTLGERASLKEYAKQKVKGDPIATNWTVYNDLLQLASTDETKDQFLSKNLMQYRSQLSDTEFKQVVELQAGLRRGDDRAESKLAGIRTTQQVVASSLKAAGIDPNAKAGTDDAERVNAFGRAVDQEGQLFEDQHKRKPNAKELQGIVDNLLVQGTIAGSGWFGTNFWADQKREFERTPGEGDFILDAKDVPAGERAKIEDTLKRNKVPVTPANVLRLYQHKLSQMVPLAPQ
jgi:hypothetical protein